MYCIVVICTIKGKGRIPSIFLFLNDLMSNRQQKLPGEQLVCIVIRPADHHSEAVTAFLISALTASVLWLQISRFVCLLSVHKRYEHEKTSCTAPVVALTACASFAEQKKKQKKNKHGSIMYEFTFLNFVIAMIHLGNGCQSAAGEITLFTLEQLWLPAPEQSDWSAASSKGVQQ